MQQILWTDAAPGRVHYPAHLLRTLPGTPVMLQPGCCDKENTFMQPTKVLMRRQMC